MLKLFEISFKAQGKAMASQPETKKIIYTATDQQLLFLQQAQCSANLITISAFLRQKVDFYEHIIDFSIIYLLIINNSLKLTKNSLILFNFFHKNR